MWKFCNIYVQQKYITIGKHPSVITPVFWFWFFIILLIHFLNYLLLFSSVFQRKNPLLDDSL